MNRTKKLLIGLVTLAAMPAFADTKTTTTSSGESRLEALFKADLQYRSESQSDAGVVAEGREGVYIGSGDGTAIGDGFAERFIGRYGLGTAFIPWCGAGNQCLRVFTFALSIPRGSSKPTTEPESDLMEEVMDFAALKNIKRTSR